MTDYATRCPHCDTTFHASQAQLEIAHGLVRCGACLEIFNAVDNRVAGWDEDTPLPENVTFEDEDHSEPPEVDESWTESLLREEDEDTGERETPPVLISERDDPEDLEDLEDLDHEYELSDDDAPLRALRAHPPTPGKRHNGLWFLLSVLAAIGLAGQYGYRHFDHLIQSPYRPWFEQTCEALRGLGVSSCELPPPAQPSLIRSEKLLIRSHPHYEQALQIDTILVNHATFDQPFPDLELAFSTLEGKTVARRRFEPPEYLAGELRGAQLMPSKQPIQIGLEIVDPGPEAVNYEMRLKP